MNNVKVFINHADKDEDFAKELVKHFRVLRVDDKEIETWSLLDVVPGIEVDEQARREIVKSSIVLCLLSVDFFIDDRCQKIITKAVYERKIIIPVLLRNCVFNWGDFKDLPLLPSNKRAVSNWEYQDDAYVDIVENVKKYVESISNEKPVQPLIEALKGKEVFQESDKGKSIFICYAHADEKYFLETSVFLKVFAQKNSLKVWSDKRIEAGQDWKKEINKELENADSAVLLVSKHFFNSTFIQEIELPKLLKARENKGVNLFLLKIDHFPLNDFEELKDIQFLHDENKPLYTLEEPDRDAIYTKLYEMLKVKYKPTSYSH